MGNGYSMARKDEVYLHDIPLEEAKRRLDQALEANDLTGVLGHEEIELSEQAISRVTAAPVWAKISSPNYHSAAMDGFAIRAAAIQGAMPTAPVTLEVGRDAGYVDTGDPLPEWADAVVPIENVEPLDPAGELAGDLRHPHQIRRRPGLPPGSRVRRTCEDI